MPKRLVGTLMIAVAALAAMTTPTATAGQATGRNAPPRASTYCGKVNVSGAKNDARVYAHNVRCKKARRVGKWFFGTGPKVRGWVCSASLGRCYEGDFGSNTYVRFNFHSTHPGQPVRARGKKWRSCGDGRDRGGKLRPGTVVCKGEAS